MRVEFNDLWVDLRNHPTPTPFEQTFLTIIKNNTRQIVLGYYCGLDNKGKNRFKLVGSHQLIDEPVIAYLPFPEPYSK